MHQHTNYLDSKVVLEYHCEDNNWQKKLLIAQTCSGTVDEWACLEKKNLFDYIKE